MQALTAAVWWFIILQPVLAMATSRELLPLEGAKSGVWKYFGFPSKDGKFMEPDKKKQKLVYCKLCGKELKYPGCTTNMRSHLESSHSPQFQALQQETKEKEGSTASSSKPVAPGQQSIASAFQVAVPLPRTSARWIKLTESVCYFVAKDMQPLDTVNDTGFRKMIHEFAPRYTPPDRKTIATNYLPRMFESEKKRIEKVIDTATYYAVTTDMWTSRAKHAYTGLTIHYICEEFTLQSHLLETREFPNSHTAANIAEELKGIIQEWSLSIDKLSAATTDNGSNIVLATEILEVQRMPCFSHTLQLAVEKAMQLPDISKAIARCKRLVTHFNHSSKSSYLLKQKQANLHHSQHCLVQDVATRWNSAFYMIERIIEQQQPLCATLLELKKGDLMPTDAEFTTMEYYVKIMKPLVIITEAIGAEKWVTISTIRPLLHKILNSIFAASPTDTRQEKAIKAAMYDNLKPRYTGELLLMLSKAAFLDPRIKLLSFLSQDEKEELKIAIETEATTVSESTTQATLVPAPVVPPPPKKAKGEHMLLDLLGDVLQPTDEPLLITATQKARAEVARYCDEPSTQENPLKWWRANAFRYPILMHLAKKYLAIPATSVPSERAFSAAGHIVSAKRASLLPSSVHVGVFS